MNMITNKRELYFYLKEDMKRNGIASIRDYYFHFLIGSEHARVFRYILCLRKCEYHYNNFTPPTHTTNTGGLLITSWHKVCYTVMYVKLKWLGSKYGIQIPINCCGYGLRIMHLSGGGGVHINAEKVGNYCGFNAGVLLGNKDSQDNRPLLGDRVAFGPGAKAIGQVRIGNNVFVAANAVVTKDVPDNVVVGGVPAKILECKDDKVNYSR